MEVHFKKALDTLAPSLVGGVGIVVYITLVGFAAALAVALLVAMGRLSKSKSLNRILIIFIEIVRGTPLLVQFFYIYYVVPMLINGLTALFGYKTNIQLPAATCGIIGFAINYGCYMSEVVRSAILAIDSRAKGSGAGIGVQ